MVSESILRFPDVIKKVGLSRTVLYELISVKDFPAPVKLGYRSVGFLNSEIEAWIAGRVRASRGEKEAA